MPLAEIGPRETTPVVNYNSLEGSPAQRRKRPQGGVLPIAQAQLLPFLVDDGWIHTQAITQGLYDCPLTLLILRPSIDRLDSL